MIPFFIVINTHCHVTRSLYQIVHPMQIHFFFTAWRTKVPKYTANTNALPLSARRYKLNEVWLLIVFGLLCLVKELLRRLLYLPFMPHFLTLSNEELHLNHNVLHSKKCLFYSAKKYYSVDRGLSSPPSFFYHTVYCLVALYSIIKLGRAEGWSYLFN